MTSISIIIPVYRVEKYIEQCLNSIMSQSYNKEDCKIECILVDDSSPDNSMAIANNLIQQYKGSIFFKNFQHIHNKGLSAARNTGLVQATGEFIFYIDSDDTIMPNCLQTFINSIKKHPNIDLIMGQTIIAKNKELYTKNIIETKIFKGRNNILYNYLAGKFNIEAWNKLIRRDLLVRNNLFFVDGILFEDLPWTYNLFSIVDTLIVTSEITYSYNYNPYGIMNSISNNPEKAIHSYIEIYKYLTKNPPSKDIFSTIIEPDYLLFIQYFMLKGLYIIIQNQVSKNEISEFITIRNQLLYRSLRKGRLSIAISNLLLFKPFCNLINYSFFRRKYNFISNIIRRISHSTDFLHNHSSLKSYKFTI